MAAIEAVLERARAMAKCPVCGQSKGYVISEHHHRRKSVQCKNCLVKWKLSVLQDGLAGLMLHELPKNGQGLSRVPSLRGPLFLALGKEFPGYFWWNLGLVAGVDWEYMGETVPSKVASAVIRGKDEKALACWNGSRVISESARVGGQTVAKKIDTDGILLLTNRRLLWLEPNVSTRVKFEIYLDGIKSIMGSSGDSGTWESPAEIHIVDDRGVHQFNLSHGFLEVFKPTVESAVALKLDEVERSES